MHKISLDKSDRALHDDRDQGVARRRARDSMLFSKTGGHNQYHTASDQDLFPEPLALDVDGDCENQNNYDPVIQRRPRGI